MSDILQKILATKHREVAEAKANLPLREIEALARDMPPVRDFVGAIRAKRAAGKLAVIAEIKRASPSAGEFRSGLSGPGALFSPARFAQTYEEHGAACLSVLTDREYFQGSGEDLVAARAACSLPVLRKDFIVDPYQILQARAMGADAVLFIMGAAPIDQFREWEDLAVSLGLGVLAESHHLKELHEALTLKTSLIGINNRDLTLFRTNIETTLVLKNYIPPDKILVTESGIGDAETVVKMASAGVGVFLVGGILMGSIEPGEALATLFSGAQA
ncbi:MAG: indole-3-glycerol phosphate synthase TrpC [Burkholderiales bacterium]|nr:indole-3-glycerol phosphate synthase TrpC [Burkholderiales bacterium]